MDCDAMSLLTPTGAQVTFTVTKIGRLLAGWLLFIDDWIWNWKEPF
jgi:hypothetical protein